MTANWSATSAALDHVSKTNGWTHINTFGLYCTPTQVCPSFVGSVPVKGDQVHLTLEYANKIVPALREQFTEAGIPI
ncbi:hypothetical protein GS461_18970 [Rhodococcus hoagii]|nr:hypothetical protein [Prescottella equi]